MEVHQVRYFLALAESLHFSRAAEHCHVSQPSLSRAIRKLEDEIGGALFERRPGSVSLTELGRHLKPHLQRSLQYLSAVKGEASAFLGHRQQNLRIGIMSTVFHPQFVAVLAKLSSKFPQVEVHIEQGSAETLQSRLISGDIDIAIVCCKALKAAEDVAVASLYEEKYCLALRDDNCLTKKERLTGEDITTEPLANTLPVALTFDIETDQPLAVRYSLFSQCFARAIVQSGIACAVVPEFASAPGLSLRPIEGLMPPRQIGIVTMRGRPQFPPAKYFLQLVRAVDDWSAARLHSKLEHAS